MQWNTVYKSQIVHLKPYETCLAEVGSIYASRIRFTSPDCSGERLSEHQREFQLRLLRDIAVASPRDNERSVYSKNGKLLFDFFDVCRLADPEPDRWTTHVDCHDPTTATAAKAAVLPASYACYTVDHRRFTRLIVEWEHVDNADDAILRLSKHKDRWKLWTLMANQAVHDFEHTLPGNRTADVFGALGLYLKQPEAIALQFFVLSTTDSGEHVLRRLMPSLILRRSGFELRTAVSSVTAVLAHIYKQTTNPDSPVHLYSVMFTARKGVRGPGPDEFKLTNTTRDLRDPDTAAQELARQRGNLYSAACIMVDPTTGEIVSGKPNTLGFMGTHRRYQRRCFVVAKVTAQREPPRMEVDAYTCLAGPGVATMIDFVLVAHGYVIALEPLAVFGGRDAPVLNNVQVSEDPTRAQKVFICSGLRTLSRMHGVGFAHGDVNKRNVGFDSDGHLVFFDLDNSFSVGRHHSPAGAKHPPCMAAGWYDQTIDVYQFGELCFSLWTRPFASLLRRRC
eukprot:TRINITY_DN7969_c0_g1_i2.p1 TRINITY_DN7969_c0_g1~~TRINITY_DN7969_c0_g1_i2.p1  ORF type:complete len:508 (-),score=63.83 TRINITY_DN7969_c0_g1_i2:659-2182(-)